MIRKAVVLMSGGLDSTVCAKIAVDKCGSKNVIGLSIAYGQNHDKEIISAMQVAGRLQLREHYRETIPLVSFIKRDLPSLMLSAEEIPDCKYSDLPDGTSPMYVPFRNGILLSYAAAFAYDQGAEAIYFGAHTEDAERYAYPDCTAHFIGSMNNAIYEGTGHKIMLVAPLAHMTKKDIVAKGIEIDAPMELTWSCYKGGEKACGTCPTCQSRIDAFKANMSIDRIPYATEIDWGRY